MGSLAYEKLKISLERDLCIPGTATLNIRGQAAAKGGMLLAMLSLCEKGI